MKSHFFETNISKYMNDETYENNRTVYTFTGLYESAFGHICSRTFTDFYIILFCVAGKGIYKCNNSTYYINPGDVFFCYPNTNYSYQADETDPWTIYWAHFKTEDKFLIHCLTCGPLTVEYPILHFSDYSELVSYFTPLLSYESDYTKPIYMNLKQVKFLELLYIILNKDNTISSNQYINLFYSYVSTHISNKITLADLEKELHLSKFHICHIVKMHTGFSPIQYILNQRISLAKSLLTNTTLSINEIAEQTGFPNSSFFCNTFKRYLDLSPSSYRNEYNK